MEANSGERESGKKVERLVNECGIVEEDEETLKRRISSHPMYGRLIETHLNCLKVGLSHIGELGSRNEGKLTKVKAEESTILPSCELDRFMEAYCLMLRELKEAMEEPMQETMSFISATYVQLRELSETYPHGPKHN